MYISHTIGQFSEAGLHEWMPVVIFHTRCHEAAASLPGWFLSRHCFKLCIILEDEPRIAKQYKCHHCCSCKNYWGKGVEGGKQVFLCHFFLLTGRSQYCEKNAFWGILITISRATICCLLPDACWLQASKNAFKVGSVKFANSPSLPFIVKKVCTGSKSSQGT